MKKVMMIAAIAAALVSCQSKGTQNNDSAVGEGVLTVAGNDSSAVAVYEGLLPAADGPGIQYVLSVDSVGPDGESGYTLVTTYLDAEGQGKNKSFTSKGKKQVIKKTVNNKQKTAYKLTPSDGDAPVYFVADELYGFLLSLAEKGFEKILQATLPTSGYLCIINHFYI